MQKVAIIGGGAAGLSAAIAAAREGAYVTIYEAQPRVGKKLLATGNGRCNLTNTQLDASQYNNASSMKPVLESYGFERIATFFKTLGLELRYEDDGRVYPFANTANSVLDVLRLECKRWGVEVLCDTPVLDVQVHEVFCDAHFSLFTRTGEQRAADAVIIATGNDFTLWSLLGHPLAKREPVLCPLFTTTDAIRGLDGVRVQCAVTLCDENKQVVCTERGEVLFREKGVSGIVIFNLSRYARPGYELSLDLGPEMQRDALEKQFAARCEQFSWRTADTLLDGFLHKRIALAVLRAAGIEPQTPADKVDVKSLARACQCLQLKVTGHDVAHAQITRGGALLEQFDPVTLESRLVPGLFGAGEALDIDGRCGGYNLHWAWASGIIAGKAAATYVAEAPCSRTPVSSDCFPSEKPTRS